MDDSVNGKHISHIIGLVRRSGHVDIAVEIREDASGVLRKRVIDSSGTETWEVA